MTTVVLPAAPPHEQLARVGEALVRVVDLEDGPRARLSVVVLSTLMPLAVLPLVTGKAELGEDLGVPAAVALAFLLPALCHLVWCAAVGERSQHAEAELLWICVITGIGTPVVGMEWLPAYGAVALAVLLVLPSPWSVVASLAVVLGMFPLAALIGPASEGLLSALLVSKALAVYALLLALSAVRQLQATRRQLAARAVAQERQRVDLDLRGTIAADLEAVLADAQRLTTMTDPARAEVELAQLVARSRGALAGARRVITSYQQPTLRTEVEAAVALLRASGIDVRLVAPRELPDTDEPAREALRAVTAELLSRPAARPVALVLTATDDGVLVSTAAHAVVLP